MLKIELSKSQMEDLGEAIDSPDTAQRFRRRLLAVKMVAAGIKRELVASTLDISSPTLCSYAASYNKGGLAALLEDKSYRPSSSASDKLEEIKELFESEAPSCASHARAMLAESFSVELSLSQVRRLMKSIGMKFIKAGVVPGKADAQLQLDFLKGLLEPRIEQARQGETRLFFVDASHFLWGAQPGYSWCFERIWIRSGSGRKRYSVLGAVDPIGEDLHFVDTDGSVNSETMCSLMLDLRVANPDSPICLVLDNARYQHARIVKELADGIAIELLYLPTYSPNLNIIERLWKWLKSAALKNQYHETYGGFRNCIKTLLESQSGGFTESLKNLLTLNFQTLNL